MALNILLIIVYIAIPIICLSWLLNRLLTEKCPQCKRPAHTASYTDDGNKATMTYICKWCLICWSTSTQSRYYDE